MTLYFDQHVAEKRSQGEGDAGDGEYGQCRPEEKGVPLPLPELMCEIDRVLADGVKKFVR